MQRNVAVTIEGDNQIAVRIGNVVCRGNVWYLGIAEPDAAPNQVALARDVRRLIDAWLTRLMELRPGAETWLPFDFSDEYTRWLACRRVDDSLIVEFGWAPVEGWAVQPFDPSSWDMAGPGFLPDATVGAGQSIYPPLFLSGLRASAAGLDAG